RAWENVALEVAVPGGAQSMQLRFAFDAVTYSRNSYGGWFIDDILVEPGALPQTGDSLVDGLQNGGLYRALVSPNPIRGDGTWIDVIGGTVSSEALRVEVFDLSGRRVWEADVTESALMWSGEDRSGERLANGVYLMSIRVHVAESWIALPIEKVAILR
ncbi:T9SS type A sorting domain-containing protein, partial [Candidatus Bipolaricaulota bacterium]|nr:T9SS type A sorting domain-containing protein [Candidatus Bipolaricaulota bacterium]